MRKILLVKPYVFLHGYQNLELPLGVMMLSAHLKREMGPAVAVTLLDLRTEKDRDAALRDALRDRPEIVGLSLMNFERPFLGTALPRIREMLPNALIVAGGAYPTGNAEEALRSFPELDLVVRGEGEETFLEVARRHAAGEDPRGAPGTVFRRDGAAVAAPDRPPVEPLDLLSMPDYDALDFERYFAPHTPMNVVTAHDRYVILTTSRGCPYRCAYCHDIFGKRFRAHGAERVLEEIARLYDRHGVREFHIVDDVFNLDRERMGRILRGIAESGRAVRLAFPNGIRGDLLTEEEIALMRAAGVYQITFSIETASPRLQELVGKRLDIERTMRNVRYAHRRGIVTKAYFMLGFPTETKEELLRTLALSRDPALDMVSYFKVAPFRNTRLAETAAAVWGAAVGEEPVDYFTGASWYERATGVPLSRMLFRAYLRFYFPWRLWRLLWRLPRPLSFLSRAFHHLSLVFHLKGRR